MKQEITFIFNPSEIGAGTRGASLGPEAIRVAARKKQDNIFSKLNIKVLQDLNATIDNKSNHQYANGIDTVIQVYKNVCDAVDFDLSKGKFPIVLAGDHSSAGGTIAGIKKSFPNKRLGVVWIDAHGDLHTPFTTPSGNIHGMPLSTALGDDNLQCKRNEVPNATQELWEQLKNIGISGPKLLPSDLIFVGLRDTEKEENAIIDRLGIKQVSVNMLEGNGAKQTAKNILEDLSDCEILYISFDVDSMDPDQTSYGTGTPVKNGLSFETTKTLIEELVKDTRVVCLEVVEVNPCLDDKKNKMAELALEIIESVVITLKKKQLNGATY